MVLDVQSLGAQEFMNFNHPVLLRLLSLLLDLPVSIFNSAEILKVRLMFSVSWSVTLGSPCHLFSLPCICLALFLGINIVDLFSLYFEVFHKEVYL